MREQLFEPGDKVILKPEEELLPLIYYYWPHKKNYDNGYIKDILTLKNIVLTIRSSEDLLDFNDTIRETYAVHFEEELDMHWRFLQDFFNLYECLKPNDTVPCLFGIMDYAKEH